MDADASVYLRPPLAAASTSQRNTAPHPVMLPTSTAALTLVPAPHGSGVLPLVDGLAAVHVVIGHLSRDVLAHLPHGTACHPQAVPLSHLSSILEDGQAGRGPSLHVDAKSPLSAPFPPTAPTSGAYPLSPVFLPCGSVAPRAGMGVLCRG